MTCLDCQYCLQGVGKKVETICTKDAWARRLMLWSDSEDYIQGIIGMAEFCPDFTPREVNNA